MTLPKTIRDLYRAMARDHVVRHSVVLPAKHWRLGGKEFKDDDFFLASARAEARRLRDHCGFNPDRSVLDMGCGVARLAIGVLAEFGEIGSYTGIDVDEDCVRWCQRHIQSAHPNFTFARVDVQNQRYNPDGALLDGAFRFPWADEAFDVIYLYSVFSHMMPDDMVPYLGEFRRLLKKQGTVFMTAFVEEGVPEVSENPAGYRRQWTGPLHCVRYDKSFFESLLGKYGFNVSRFDYGQETDGQSAIYLSLR